MLLWLGLRALWGGVGFWGGGSRVAGRGSVAFWVGFGPGGLFWGSFWVCFRSPRFGRFGSLLGVVWLGRGGSRFLRASLGTVNGGFSGSPVQPLIHDDLLAGAHCYPAARSTRRGKKKNLEALIVHFG